MPTGPFEDKVAWQLRDIDPTQVSGTEGASANTYAQSMQEILRENIGNFVKCEFLVGTTNLTVKSGILYAAGNSFLILYEIWNQEYIVCDFYSLKFITFLEPGTLERRGIVFNNMPGL